MNRVFELDERHCVRNIRTYIRLAQWPKLLPTIFPTGRVPVAESPLMRRIQWVAPSPMGAPLLPKWSQTMGLPDSGKFT